MQNRVAAIDAFLREARAALVPYNVFLATDIFGYVCWNPDDTRIGQQLERIAEIVDYISPMLYPIVISVWDPRLPKSRAAFRTRSCSGRSHERLSAPASLAGALPPVAAGVFRTTPLEAGRSPAVEVRAQVTAAEDIGTNGWMMWNPHNRYSRGDVRARDEAALGEHKTP
jgi:hypothetical protein